MRTRKKISASLMLLPLAVLYAHASALSIQVLQHDANAQGIRSSSYLIEDTMMDFFFENGSIASTVPVVSSKSEATDAAFEKKALEEAAAGFCSYLVLVYADYDTSESRNPSADLLCNMSSVSWKVLDVQSGSVVSTGKRFPPRQQSSKDIVTFVRELCASIAVTLRR